MTDPIASDYSVTTALWLRFDDDTTLHAELCFDIADPLIVSVVISGQHSVQVWEIGLSLFDEARSSLVAGYDDVQIILWDTELMIRLDTPAGAVSLRCDAEPVYRLLEKAHEICQPDVERLAIEVSLLQWLEESGLSTNEIGETI